MNTLQKFIILALILILLIPTSTASEDKYTVKLTTELKSTNTWFPSYIEVNTSTGPLSINGAGGVTIAYKDYDSISQVAWLSLTPPLDGRTELPMNIGSVACFKDYTITQCIDNGTASKDGAIRLTVTNIIKQTSQSSLVSTTSDNVVNIYLISTTGNELSLTKNGEDTYDVKSYGEEKGWTSQGSTESLQLIVEKIVSNPMSLTIITNGEYIEENTGDADIRRIILKSNMPYEFQVKYTESSSWGLSNDKILTYKLNIKGLDVLQQSSTSSPSLSFPAPYDVEIEKSKDLTLPSGKFTDSSVSTIEKVDENENSEIKWRITFHEVGIQELTYTLSNDKIVKVPFRIIKAQVSNTEQSKTQAAQESSSGSSASIALAIIAVLVLGIVFLFLTKRRGASKRTTKISAPEINNMG